MKGLIVGLANDQSLAWGCASALHDQGATLALTYLNDKARPHVEPLAQAVEAPIFLPLDVTRPEEVDALFDAIATEWGSLDFLLHSIAFAPKEDLQGRVLDSSAEGFATAMMTNGGSILTMSFYGSEKVIPGYGIMGPVKAALEASVRYLAAELGPSGVRVNALSTGPVRTRAASGLSHFDDLMAKAAETAPMHQLVTIEQVGEMAAFLLSPRAPTITGQTIYVDAGYNVTG
jgi:enoyl-[acyl-carrier protein] reductase I